MASVWSSVLIQSKIHKSTRDNRKFFVYCSAYNWESGNLLIEIAWALISSWMLIFRYFNFLECNTFFYDFYYYTRDNLETTWLSFEVPLSRGPKKVWLKSRWKSWFLGMWIKIEFDQLLMYRLWHEFVPILIHDGFLSIELFLLVAFLIIEILIT